jgi:hypothetical protein
MQGGYPRFDRAGRILGASFVLAGFLILASTWIWQTRISRNIVDPPAGGALESHTVRLPAIERVEQEESVSTPENHPPLSDPPRVVAAAIPSSPYHLHENITATVFWVGESASADNGWISNTKSAWDHFWMDRFGGYDDPTNRNGFLPTAFTPKENPFYVALPYGDYTVSGLKESIQKVPWYKPIRTGESLLKNRWVKITTNGRTAYAQWEDVGPFETDDFDYVFGVARPKYDVGIDVSPAVRDFLEIGGKGLVSWQFVDEQDVPDGPWKLVVTTSGPNW